MDKLDYTIDKDRPITELQNVISVDAGTDNTIELIKILLYRIDKLEHPQI